MGKFNSNDYILCVKNNCSYSVLSIDLNQRFKLNDILILEKFDPENILSCMYYNTISKNNYIKRFNVETSTIDKEFIFLESNDSMKLLLATVQNDVIFKFNYHSKSGSKKIKEIDVDDFVDQMNNRQFEDVMNFFNSMPKLRHIVNVTNPNTKVQSEVVLEGLQSFLG